MTQQLHGQIRREVDLIERYSRSYRQKLSLVIDQLNHKPVQVSDLQCLRLCVEAVDMVLATQNELAKALREMSGPEHTRKAA